MGDEWSSGRPGPPSDEWSRRAAVPAGRPVPPGDAGTVEVSLRALKPYKASNGDPRTFGAAVAGFGFIE